MIRLIRVYDLSESDIADHNWEEMLDDIANGDVYHIVDNQGSDPANHQPEKWVDPHVVAVVVPYEQYQNLIAAAEAIADMPGGEDYLAAFKEQS